MGYTDNQIYEWWLAGIRGVAGDKKKLLREAFGNGKEIYQSVYNIEEKKLQCIAGLTRKEIRKIRDAVPIESVAVRYHQAVDQGIRLILYNDKEYPSRLRHHPGMPYALFLKGTLPREDAPTAAIVGARQCTAYGESMAIHFGEELALSGVQIISGMAIGIDGAAQRAALQAGGYSLGVLGSGVDVCYPRENRGLYGDLGCHGGLLSELPPNTPPLREHFPARNRIISALADMVLVMEAKEKSGSLITVDFALEQGKDVYALPGPVTSALSRGCLELIDQGADILLTPQRLMEKRKYITPSGDEEEAGIPAENKKMLESEEELLYGLIGLYPKSLGELLADTGMVSAVCAQALTSLQIKGYIREISKNYYIKV